MVKDLMVFAVLLMIFFISFGVCASSLLYPNENDIIHALTGIVSIGYWKIYGELHIEEIVYQNQTDGKISENLAPVTGDYEEVCSVRGRCPDYHWIVTILLMLYLLITNILLINLLIATFASTYEKIRSESDTIWKFQRYELIKEYQDRPVLPPPLIILNHIFYGLIWIKDYFQACIVGRIRTNIEKYDSQVSDNEYLSEAPELQKQKRRKTIGSNKNPYGRKVTSQTRNIVSKYRLFTSYDFGLEVLDQYAEFEALMTEDYFITLKIMNNKQHTKVINRISEDQRNHHQLQLQVNERLNGVETKLIERMDIIEKALLDLRRVMIDDTFYDGMSRVPTSISRRNSFTNNLNIPGTPQIIPVSGPSNVTAGNNTIKIASRNAGNKSKNSSKLNTRNNSIFSSKSKVNTPSINPAATSGITPQHHRGIKFSPSTVEREDAREEFQKRQSIGAMQVHNELESETDSSVTHLKVPGTEIKVCDVDQQSFHGSGSDVRRGFGSLIF